MVRSQYTQEELHAALKLLGVQAEDFARVKGSRTLEEAAIRLQALKDRLKKAYRLCAKTLHPDVTGGDETKTARLRLLNLVVSDLEKLTPQEFLPPPRVQIRRQFYVVIRVT